ncbi:protein FAM228A [Clinocottus analis]|uniref:protein FAM228A n=1 Tax=Clinocottus analis TaxID=304258 RepID=UPI0035C11415
MSPQKKDRASGVITFHTPFHASMFNSEAVRDATARRGGPSLKSARTSSKRDEEASPSGAQPGAKQDRRSHASIRRLKAKMEAEKQQAKEITQPLLDAEDGFMKDLDRFLSQRDVVELRRKEMLHKRWTERVWFPLQRSVEEHVSSCSLAAIKRRQNLYSHYLHHCNNKGYVFLETYNVTEYNPLLLRSKKPHFFKFSPVDLKDPLYLQLHERLKEKRTAGSCEAESRYTRRPAETLPQRDPPLCESAPPRTDVLRRASSNHPDTASRNPPAGDEAEGRTSSGLDTTPDGWCYQTSCWLLRFGPQPAS